LVTKQIEVLNNQRLLVGVSVPHLIFYTEGRSADDLAAPGPFEMKVLRDFVGFVSIPLIPRSNQVVRSEIEPVHDVNCDNYITFEMLHPLSCKHFVDYTISIPHFIQFMPSEICCITVGF